MAEIVNSAPQNESKPHVLHTHSHFPIKFKSFDTHQFGYIRPHLALLGVPSDSFRHRPVIKSRSYTLRAPLMQDVFRSLAYFKVNLDAILPLNAEKVYTNPTIGDDVLPNVNCVVSNFFYRIRDTYTAVSSAAFAAFGNTKNAANLTACLKVLIFGECFYSRGSLLASLGAHLYSQFVRHDSAGNLQDFDDYFDMRIREILAGINGVSFYATIDSVTYTVNPLLDLDSSLTGNEISFRDFLILIRETSDWFLQSVDDPTFASISFTGGSLNFYSAGNAPFNLQRPLSYQLACAEFFTNDHVDYVYSAELYRQYIGDLIHSFSTNNSLSYPGTFTYNGVSYQYDYLSGYYFESLFDFIANNPSVFATDLEFLQYVLSIFGLKRSLRYKDYFVGSRTAPLAVGDVNVSVNANLVNVVDVSRKIQLQRFLNVVNHTGRRLSNYVKSLFGVDVKPDRHVPTWLATIDELVYTAEVENTGAAQMSDAQSVTAIFTSNSSNKEIGFGIDLQSCIIGVTFYDIERAYTTSVDRDFFIKDRFDMFVPQLQFVGDQPVYRSELKSHDSNAFGTSFGYQFRDMQWKLIYSRASGGFVGKLPGYAFITRPYLYQGDNISPEFIRSFPSEFDNFYVSLSGYSLGNYFHFIVVTDNIVEADRPMIANPSILE